MPVTITGIRETIADLTAKAARCRDLTPALKVGAEIIKTSIDDAFRQSRAPDGSSWAPNRPSTIQAKGSSKPGIDTGRLRSSVSATVEGGSTIVFGTNVPYAGALQNGSRQSGALKHASKGRAKGSAWIRSAPARPFLPVDKTGAFVQVGPSATALAKVKRIVLAWITTGKLT